MANEPTKITEKIFNVKNVVLDYAAAKTHDHEKYALKTELNSYLTNNTASSTYLTKIDANNDFLKKSEVKHETNESSEESKIPTIKALKNYITTQLSNYLTKSEANNTYIQQNDFNNFTEGLTFSNPEPTTTEVDELQDSGFYQYNTDNHLTFVCGNETVTYNHGIIEIKRLGNDIIYHAYASTGNQLNGKEYIKYNNEEWRVYKIPFSEMHDVLNERGENVEPNSFKIFESTAGFTFQWVNGDDKRYQLVNNKNNYESVYTYTELPIEGEYIFGNLIGHCDIKITRDETLIRSIDQRGEYIEGVEASFFIPRNN